MHFMATREQPLTDSADVTGLLAAHLDDPNDRHERAQIPEPTGRQPGITLQAEDGGKGNSHEQQSRD